MLLQNVEHYKLERDDIQERLESEKSMNAKMMGALKEEEPKPKDGKDDEFRELKIKLETEVTKLQGQLELKDLQLKTLQEEKLEKER